MLKKSLKFLFVFILLWIQNINRAEAIRIEWHTETVSLKDGWGEFINSIRKDMGNPNDFLYHDAETYGHYEYAYLRIARLKEIPNTLVLVFNYTTVMHFALFRASVYIENLSGFHTSESQLVPQYNRIILKNKPLTDVVLKSGGGGHDLRAKDLLEYWQVFDSIDQRHFHVRPNMRFSKDLRFERKVREALEEYLWQNPDTAIASFALSRYNVVTVTHELAHTQFFNNPAYTDAVWQYWNQMSDEDRDYFRNSLQNSFVGYDKNNEALIVNEFQAYMNSINAHLWSDLFREKFDPHYSLFKAHLMKSLPDSELIALENVEGSHRLSLCSKFLLAK